MKKIFVLLILSALSVSLFAQTQKLHVFGFTLGETKSGTVRDCFEKEGLLYELDSYTTGPEGKKGYVPHANFKVENVLFIGVTWDLAHFNCIQYSLKKVEFIKVIPAASRKIVSSKISEIISVH